ncbi:sphingosine-1-phosphate phosphatase 2-like [Mytilus californianus]|uniref:sphingosine-1-phosphate phosphatase 2-like n=1 Tax=Mytilus californianus TaxID=6549 RepID=UPI00224544E1|nr:sphingosine-1-phosphate phosphatase 2-like [Mytilus californianus]
MGRLKTFFHLSNPEYTAQFQRLCGVYLNYKSDQSSVGSSGNENNACIVRKRTGLQDSGKNKIIENQNQNESQDTVFRTPKSEADRIWMHLSMFQKSLFYILTFASSLGNEAFYLLFYPYVAWNMDSVVVRRTNVVWTLCMYAGQAAKDYLIWPRPSSPPVVRLETDFLQEYAMPSTHAMSATAIPFMLAYTIIHRYDISPVFVICVAICWCLLVCLSRLYLGVHSVLDLLCGVISSLIIILLTVPYMKEFDMFQQSHPVAPLVVFGISLALSTVCYPNAKDGSPYTAKADAVQIVAVSAGVTLGTWINYQFGFTVDKGQVFQAQIVIPTITMMTESLLRFIVGIVVLGALYSVVKKSSVHFFSYVLNLEKPNKKHPSVEIGYKFVTYYVLGFAIIFLVPYIHFLLGLGRSAYFNEVQ